MVPPTQYSHCVITSSHLPDDAKDEDATANAENIRTQCIQCKALHIAQLAHEMQSVRACSRRQDDAEDDLKLKYTTKVSLCHAQRNSCTTL